MKKISLLLLLLVSIIANKISAVNYTSSGSGPSDWTNASTWTPNGVPTTSDNVTISAGHTVTINSAGSRCKNLTVAGTISFLSNVSLDVSGLYVLSGTELGTGRIVLTGNGNLNVTGTTSQNLAYAFNANITILAGSVINKGNTNCSIAANKTVTNLGTLTMIGMTTTTGSVYINGTNAILTVKFTGFMTGRTFDASASGNTVNLQYQTGTVPITTSGYYNLTIAGTVAGAKTLSANTIVANNLTINATNTLNSNGFDLTVGGNWTNNGTFTPGTRTVTFNGTGAQAITRTGGETFYDVVFSNAGTKTLGSNMTVNNDLTINAGTLDVSASNFTVNVARNWTNNGGTFNPRTGTVNFTGAAQTITKSTGETFNNLVLGGNNTKTLGGPITTNANITINGGVTLDVSASNYDVTVKGNWINNGTFNAQNGTVTFNGTSTQTLSNSSPITFSGLTINNTAGVSLSTGTYTLTRVLTLSNGTFSTGGRPFTMTSTASQTARIAPIAGTGAISGNFTIQRFISARDTTWADLASTVQSSTFADWDNELPARYYVYSPPSSYPTQYSYSESADDFVPITSNSTPLIPGKGYEVFLTGDYSYSNLPNTTLDVNGVPNQGNQNLSSLISFSNAGSNLVGNPFASSISWSTVRAASSRISNNYDVYDFTAGTYSTFGLGTEIGSGQGFWVYSTGASPTLIVNENAKTSSSNSTLKNNQVIEEYFKLKLTNQNNFYNQTIRFAANTGANDGFDIEEDHPFRKSPNRGAPGIFCLIDNKKAVINTFNSNNVTYSVPLQVTSNVEGVFTIVPEGFDFITDYNCIKLEDTFLKVMIDLKETPFYQFRINPADNPNRFVLHFGKDNNCKSFAGSSIAENSNNNSIEILPAINGNTVNFNLTSNESASIKVINLLGQNIIESINLTANTQSIYIAIPENYSGVYFIEVSTNSNTVTKKFIKK